MASTDLENQSYLSTNNKVKRGNGWYLVEDRPLLALSGLGAAIGSFTSILRKMKLASPFKLFKTPKFPKMFPKYLRSNYIKYPALFIVILASTRKLRDILNR